MMETLFRSRVMGTLIAYFVKNQDKEVYLREIGRVIEEPASAVQRELDRLESFGFLESRRHGNHKYFKVREDFSLLPELRGMFLKTEGSVDYLRDSLRALQGVQLAFLYGEFAEKQSPDVSEIYLAIIGIPDRDELERAIKDMQVRLGRSIYYTHYSPIEFKQLLESKDPSISKVLSGEKLILVAQVSDRDKNAS